jgi:hypothetical protein
MRAYDPDNVRFCFWIASNPASAPAATLPASVVSNLQNKAIVHEIS